MLSVGIIKSGRTFHPDRAPFKEVLGGQYTYRGGEKASVAAGRL